MSTVTKHPEGRFCWSDLLTTDIASARRFYASVFGWTFEEHPTPQGGPYVIALLQTDQVTALSPMPPDMMAQKIPPSWNAYVCVADAAATTKKAEALGAKIVMSPTDVMGEGRMAMIAEPSGGVFSLWQPLRHQGAQRVQEPGSLAWVELMSADVERSTAFLAQLFGWVPHVKDMGSAHYTTWRQGEHRVAGMMAIGKGETHIPPHWMVYFAVADADSAAQKIVAAGGRMQVPPTDIPEVGRWAIGVDPQGAYFGLIKFTGPQ
jgi:predicted enzyme related to lactoylglutathione lyase